MGCAPKDSRWSHWTVTARHRSSCWIHARPARVGVVDLAAVRLTANAPRRRRSMPLSRRRSARWSALGSAPAPAHGLAEAQLALTVIRRISRSPAEWSARGPFGPVAVNNRLPNTSDQEVLSGTTEGAVNNRRTIFSRIPGINRLPVRATDTKHPRARDLHQPVNRRVVVSNRT